MQQLEKKYTATAWLYDLLDYPWERLYRKWRPLILEDVTGDVLEAGVGTGRNLPYYSENVNLTAIDLSQAMLKKAKKRAQKARCQVSFYQEDVCHLTKIADRKFDWIIATFLCCVLPSEFHQQALNQFASVLKPGGHLRLIEIVYSKDPKIKKRQQRLAKFAEFVYGVRFERNILPLIQKSSDFTDVKMRYLKEDTHLLIDATRV